MWSGGSSTLDGQRAAYKIKHITVPSKVDAWGLEVVWCANRGGVRESIDYSDKPLTKAGSYKLTLYRDHFDTFTRHWSISCKSVCWFFTRSPPWRWTAYIHLVSHWAIVPTSQQGPKAFNSVGMGLPTNKPPGTVVDRFMVTSGPFNGKTNAHWYRQPHPLRHGSLRKITGAETRPSRSFMPTTACFQTNLRPASIQPM